MKKAPQLEEIKSQISHCLKGATKDSSPNIYVRVQTWEGYRWAENEVLSLVLSTGQDPAACMSQVETDLNVL